MIPPNTTTIPMAHSADLETAARALDGDPEAARAILNLQPALVNILLSKSVPRSTAVELAADIISRCFGAGKDGPVDPLLSKYAGKCSLSTYLIKVTVNHWRDSMRRSKYRGDLPEQYDEDGDRDAFDRIPAEPPPARLDGDIAKILADAIREGVSTLDEETVRILRYQANGMTQVEIAELYKRPQTSISRTVVLARNHLAMVARKAIKEADPHLSVCWEDIQHLGGTILDCLASFGATTTPNLRRRKSWSRASHKPQPENLRCPHCQHDKLRRYGKTAYNTQRWVCKQCRRTFIE